MKLIIKPEHNPVIEPPKYLVRVDGTIRGPVTMEGLNSLVYINQLPPHAELANEGSSDFKGLRSWAFYPKLFPARKLVLAEPAPFVTVPVIAHLKPLTSATELTQLLRVDPRHPYLLALKNTIQQEMHHMGTSAEAAFNHIVHHNRQRATAIEIAKICPDFPYEQQRLARTRQAFWVLNFAAVGLNALLPPQGHIPLWLSLFALDFLLALYYFSGQHIHKVRLPFTAKVALYFMCSLVIGVFGLAVLVKLAYGKYLDYWDIVKMIMPFTGQ